MPSQQQTIVQPTPTSADFGQSDTANLANIFAGSPVHSGKVSDNERRKSHQLGVRTGDVQDSFSSAGGTALGGPGHGISSFDRDFTGAPDVSAIDINDDSVLGEKLPSPYMPNPASPGPGSLNASDKPQFTGTIPDMATNVEFGTGLGGTANPSDTAPEIAKQSNAIGTYISGRSYAGSAGTP